MGQALIREHSPLIAPHITIVPTDSDAIVGEPVRILVHQPEAIESIRSLCRSEFSSRCRTEIYYNPNGTLHSLGIFAPRADKGTALALVLDRLAVGKERVLAIGDNLLKVLTEIAGESHSPG